MLGQILKKKNCIYTTNEITPHEPGQTWLATNIDLNE